MNRPVIFGDNVFSITAYPSHVIDAKEEPTGFGASNVANGRRSSLNYATATTTNSPWWIRSAFNRVRSFDMWGLDRGHNLAGITVQPQLSDIGSTLDADWTTIANVIIPANPGSGSLDDTYGVCTEEGAWLWRHPVRSANYVRLYVPALGIGVLPKVVGLWCGLSYSPSVLRRPSTPDGDVLAVEETVSALAWRGRGRIAQPRQGSIRLKMSDYWEYEQARYHLHRVFSKRPTWLIHDEDQADRAVLAWRPAGGLLGLTRESGGGWAYPVGQLDWYEHEPAAA